MILRSNYLSGKFRCTEVSFSNPDGDWAPGSCGSVLNGPGEQWSMSPEDITLIRSPFFTVWTQCLTEKNNYYFDNKVWFSQYGDPNEGKSGGVIPLDTRVHHLVSKALPVQEFSSYRVNVGSQRAGPVKSLQIQLFLCVTRTLQSLSVQRVWA